MDVFNCAVGVPYGARQQYRRYHPSYGERQCKVLRGSPKAVPFLTPGRPDIGMIAKRLTESSIRWTTPSAAVGLSLAIQACIASRSLSARAFHRNFTC